MIENRFKNYTLTLILTIILSVISALDLGVFGFLFTTLLASVIGYTVIKHHYYLVCASCVCAIIVYSLFLGDFVLAVTSLIPILLCGISLGIAHNINLAEFKTISIISCIYALYFFITIKIAGNNYNLNVISDSLKTTASAYKEILLSSVSGISQAEVDALITNIIAVLTKFMPSLVIIACVCIALLMFYIFKKILRITKSNIDIYKPFSEWQLDKSISLTYILIFVISFIIPEGYFADALANVLVVSTFIFYIFGVSFADFLLKRVLKSRVIRKICMILIAVLPIFSFGFPFILISILGMSDGLFNYKEKIAKNKTSLKR